MHKLPVLTVALLGVACLPAQTNVTAPPGLLSQSGGSHTNLFGHYARGRHQFADGSMTRRAGTLLSVSYRTQSRTLYEDFNGMGRSWSSFALSMGECDSSKITSNLNGNYIGRGTRVFSGKLSLPTLKGRPKQAWGNVATIPLQTTYSWSGKNDLLFDYTFSGGTLANRAYWNASRSYFTDGVMSSSGSLTVFPEYLPKTPHQKSGGQSCNDSAHAHPFGAYAYHRGVVYSDAYPVAGLRGKVSVTRSYTYHTAPNSVVVMALTLGGQASGLQVGTGCNRLYVNMSQVISMVAASTDAASGRGPAKFSSNYVLATVPYKDAWAGTQTFMQAGWMDSKTGMMSLSTATRLTLPRKPRKYRKAAAYEFYDGSTRISPVVSDSTYLQSLPRLTWK